VYDEPMVALTSSFGMSVHMEMDPAFFASAVSVRASLPGVPPGLLQAASENATAHPHPSSARERSAVEIREIL